MFPHNPSLLFASTNIGKLSEIRQIITPYNMLLLSPKEIFQTALPPTVDETGTTYFQNAKLKADAFYLWSGIPTIADDTGLEVSALGGQPGVKSARFAGDTATMSENISLLRRKLDGISDRSALFRCVLYLKLSEDDYLTAEGTLEGEIGEDEVGSAGFGYDGLFLVGSTKRSLASLKEDGPVETHRSIAFRNLYEQMKLRALV